MDINNMVNNLTWKKMAAIALVIVTANWMIHEVIMWRYFNKFEQTVNRFNDQFVQDQQRIHNKIIESENDFNKWSKKFEQNQNEFSAVVDKGMKENLNFIQNSCLGVFIVTPCYASQLIDKNIIIFVSFSMPDESLKGWLREANIISAPVIVRGFINNSFKDTINKIGILTTDNHGGVQIDPLLFERFHVDKVPAVIVVKDPDCMPGMSCTLDYAVVYGDVICAQKNW